MYANAMLLSSLWLCCCRSPRCVYYNNNILFLAQVTLHNLHRIMERDHRKRERERERMNVNCVRRVGKWFLDLINYWFAPNNTIQYIDLALIVPTHTYVYLIERNTSLWALEIMINLHSRGVSNFFELCSWSPGKWAGVTDQVEEELRDHKRSKPGREGEEGRR